MPLESLIEENYVSGVNWWNDMKMKILQPGMSSSLLGLLAAKILATSCTSSMQSFTSQSSMPQLVVFKMHMALNLAMRLKADFLWVLSGPQRHAKCYKFKGRNGLRLRRVL